jgi:hypothetical protein
MSVLHDCGCELHIAGSDQHILVLKLHIDAVLVEVTAQRA